MLRRLVPAGGPVLYADHLAGCGIELFRSVCKQDLEGIVAKLASGVYNPDATTWVKIKNRAYSQAVGRHEFFEQRRGAVA